MAKVKETGEDRDWYKRELGRRIGKVIADRELQQKDVAREAGLSKSTLSEAISGKRGRGLDIPQVDRIAKAIAELSGQPCSRADLVPPDEIAHVAAETGSSRGKLEGGGKSGSDVRPSAGAAASLHPKLRDFLAGHQHEFTEGQISFLRDGFNFGPDAVLDDEFFYDLIRAHTARMERKAHR
jgi:DNA-binding Xre family transcriptional regulator